MMKRVKKHDRKRDERFAFAVIKALSLTTALVLLLIIGYITWNAIPALNWQFVAGTPGDPLNTGIWPMAVNTLLLVVLTLAIALPLGILAAVYLKEYVREGPFVAVVRSATENLAGMPSIIFGLFGLVFFGKVLGLGWSLANGTLTASIIVLPTIMRTTEEALKSVPQSYREGSLALGATRWQTVKKVVLVSAFPGIMSGSMLAIGRVVGETAALMFTLGSSERVATSLMDSGRTLAMHLYMLAHEGLSVEGAFATAFVLVVVVLAVNVTAEMLANRALGRGGRQIGR